MSKSMHWLIIMRIWKFWVASRIYSTLLQDLTHYTVSLLYWSLHKKSS